MRRTLALSTVLSLAGCAQIFGLDETSSGGGNDGKVSLSLTRASIGASVTMAPLDVSMQTATFLADDGAGGYLRVPGAVTSPGTFSAAELTEAVPVEFTLPGVTGERIWATGARAQRGSQVVFEHPGAEPPLPNSAVAVMTTLPSAYVSGESFKVEVVGAWMQHGVAAAELPAVDMGSTAIMTPAIPYSMYTPMVGNSPARFTSSDVVLFLRYRGGVLSDVLQQQLDQTDGTDTITGTMTPVATTASNLMAIIDPPALMTRYAAVRPNLTTALAQSYAVRAAPGASLGQAAGTVLASGAPAATETSFAKAFGNPFESLGWKSVVEYATSMSRAYMIDPTHSVTLSANLSTIAEVGTDPITFDSPAGLPITIQINSTLLTADGTSVMLDLTKPVVVDATIDRTQNTVYAARLFELDVSGANVAKTLVAEMVVTGMPQFAFPPALFMTGHTYFIQVACYQGRFTDAASGDLQTVTLPYSSGTLDSGVFTVMP
ncbi:MAG: hypothetical protein HOV81_28105 [Kofleriaceae bacterium]|nr:hypothetical protein [Kofleriaceae bacterium]